HPGHVSRGTALEKAAEQMAQRAEPAQDGRHQRPRQRAVALGERRKPETGVLELLVKRPAAAQYAFEHVGGKTSRRQARDFGFAGHLPGLTTSASRSWVCFAGALRSPPPPAHH